MERYLVAHYESERWVRFARRPLIVMVDIGLFVWLVCIVTFACQPRLVFQLVIHVMELMERMITVFVIGDD